MTKKMIVGAIAGCVLIQPLATETLNAQATEESVKQAKADADLADARTRELKARQEAITALNLPRYDGSTTTAANAGQLEATMLSADALGTAARTIVGRLPEQLRSKPIIVLAGAETFEVAPLQSVRGQLQLLEEMFDWAGESSTSGSIKFNELLASLAEQQLVAGGATSVVQIGSAVLGMLSSTTSIAPAGQVQLQDRMLATAVAAHLRPNGRLPSALLLGNVGQNSLGERMSRLHRRRLQLLDQRSSLAGRRDRSSTARSARIDAAVKAFETAQATLMTTDANGTSPLSRAARLDALTTGNPMILRLHVEGSGGTLTNTQNLLTRIALDPVRVTGGAILSFTLTDPTSGSIQDAGVLVCPTYPVRMNRVHQGTWRRSNPGQCRDITAA